MDDIVIDSVNHNYHNPEDSEFIIGFGNEFAVLFLSKRRYYRTTLLSEDADNVLSAVHNTGRNHDTAREAMLWIVKWYYYT